MSITMRWKINQVIMERMKILQICFTIFFYRLTTRIVAVYINHAQ